MGKNITAQKRGKGSPRYRAPSFRYPGKARHFSRDAQGIVTDIVHSAGHTAPLLVITYPNREKQLAIAAQGIKVGDNVATGGSAEAKNGATLPLGAIAEGELVCNIESVPGDGGKFVRASGMSARVLSKTADIVLVELPSKKKREFRKECRATIGIVAGGGRKEKPFLKAGNKHYRQQARNKLYPRTSAVAMNAVDHPFGGSSSAHKGKPTTAPRYAPPGRKVGMIRARRTGRKGRK